MDETITIVKDRDLGGQLNPVSNNQELLIAMAGRRNCCIYTKGTFQVTKVNLYELKIRNIKLIGLAFTSFSKKLEKAVLNGTSDITCGLNIEKGIKVNYERRFKISRF